MFKILRYVVSTMQ